MTDNILAFATIFGIPTVATVLVYFLLHRRLGFLLTLVLAYLASCALFAGVGWLQGASFSGFEGVGALFAFVAYLPYCLLIAWLCSRLMRRGPPAA